jgi:hemerythrin superfamily protein
MDSMMSKGKGTLHAWKARIEGLVGVFKTLAEQHAAVLALMERVQTEQEKRAELWPKIRSELRSHEHAEIREVYPVLRELEDTRRYADHHGTEAKKLEELIDRIDATDMSLAMWPRLFDELVDMVTTHAKEEETLIFPRAQTAIGKARSKELDVRFMTTKKQLDEVA